MPSSFSTCGSFDANSPASSSCSEVRMLTPNRWASRTMGSVRASLSKHTRTSGGSSDSEQRAFAVIPPKLSGLALVTTATPVANRPNTSRNSSRLTVVVMAADRSCPYDLGPHEVFRPASRQAYGGGERDARGGSPHLRMREPRDHRPEVTGRALSGGAAVQPALRGMP